METQTPHNGLTQLFMSLGLSTASPLKGIEGASEEGVAFDSLLAGYLPQAPDVSKSGLKPLSESVSNSALLSGENKALHDSLLEQGLDELNLLPGSIQGLPLTGDDLGDNLPLSESMLAPVVHATQRKEQLSSDLLSNAEVSSEEPEVDDGVQALLANQGFHAQSLVTSLMPGKPVATPAMGAISASLKTATENAGAAMAALGSAANKSNSLESSTSSFDTSSLALEGESDGDDKFLGANVTQETLKGNKPPKVFESITPQLSATLNNNTVVTEQASIINTALAMNEDPTDLSLQELSDLEEIERKGVSEKLTTLERKQDDQTLKLTKGQQAWGDALASKITMNAAKNVQQVTIHLDPPELGSLELKLNVKDDQQTQVQVQVQNPQVKEALESSANRLRDMLAEQGLELSEFDVQTGSQQGGQGEQQASDADTLSNQQDSDALVSDDDVILNIPTPKNNNLLDTFV